MRCRTGDAREVRAGDGEGELARFEVKIGTSWILGLRQTFQSRPGRITPVESDEAVVFVELEFEPTVDSIPGYMPLQSGSGEDHGLTVDGGGMDGPGCAAIVIEEMICRYVELENQRGHTQEGR